jgi:hypothetical protein
MLFFKTVPLIMEFTLKEDFLGTEEVTWEDVSAHEDSELKLSGMQCDVSLDSKESEDGHQVNSMISGTMLKNIITNHQIRPEGGQPPGVGRPKGVSL